MLTAESASAQKDAEPARHDATAASPEAALDGGYSGATGWLDHDLLSRPANEVVRALAMRRVSSNHRRR